MTIESHAHAIRIDLQGTAAEFHLGRTNRQGMVRNWFAEIGPGRPPNNGPAAPPLVRRFRRGTPHPSCRMDGLAETGFPVDTHGQDRTIQNTGCLRARTAHHSDRRGMGIVRLRCSKSQEDTWTTLRGGSPSGYFHQHPRRQRKTLPAGIRVATGCRLDQQLAVPAGLRFQLGSSRKGHRCCMAEPGGRWNPQGKRTLLRTTPNITATLAPVPRHTFPQDTSSESHRRNKTLKDTGVGLRTPHWGQSRNTPAERSVARQTLLDRTLRGSRKGAPDHSCFHHRTNNLRHTARTCWHQNRPKTFLEDTAASVRSARMTPASPNCIQDILQQMERSMDPCCERCRPDTVTQGGRGACRPTQQQPPRRTQRLSWRPWDGGSATWEVSCFVPDTYVPGHRHGRRRTRRDHFK